MEDLEKWKEQLQRYYNNKFFMTNPNNWQELANAAVEKDYQKELQRRNTSNTLPEVTVTATTPTQKTIAVERDFTPEEMRTTGATPSNLYYSSAEDKAVKDQQRFDLQNSIRNKTNKWGTGIGLTTTGLVGGGLIASMAPEIAAAASAFKAAHPLLYSGFKFGADTAFTVDGLRNTLSNNGVQKTYRIGKDMYQNGFTGKKAFDFTKSLAGDVLDIAGGFGTARTAIKSAEKEFNTLRSIYDKTRKLKETGQLRGLYDEIKYNLYDKVQGVYLYNKMPSSKGIYDYQPFHPSHNTAIDEIYTVGGKRRQGLPLTTTEQKRYFDTPVTSGIAADDNMWQVLSTDWQNSHSNFGFMNNAGHTRVGGETGRQWRMGFSTQPGQRLPHSFAEAQRQAIAHAPSGSFISADSHHLTVPEHIEFLKKMNIKQSLWKAIQNMDDWSFTNTPYGMSPDAYRFFTKQSQLPGNKTVYAGKTGLFNEYAVRNADIYRKQEAYRHGDITAKEYVDYFNNWAKEFGGRPAHVDFKTGEPFIYHPVIYKKKNGGKLNYLKIYG